MDPRPDERPEPDTDEVTELALQDERDAIDAAASEPRYAPPGTQAGGPRPVLEEEEVEEAVFINQKTGEEKTWEELSTDEKLDVLMGGLMELGKRVIHAEQAAMLTGQSLLRVLHKAGELDTVETPAIEVPRMDLPRGKR